MPVNLSIIDQPFKEHPRSGTSLDIDSQDALLIDICISCSLSRNLVYFEMYCCLYDGLAFRT